MDKNPNFFKTRFPVPTRVLILITRVFSGSQNRYPFSSIYQGNVVLGMVENLFTVYCHFWVKPVHFNVENLFTKDEILFILISCLFCKYLKPVYFFFVLRLSNSCLFIASELCAQVFGYRKLAKNVWRWYLRNCRFFPNV